MGSEKEIMEERRNMFAEIQLKLDKVGNKLDENTKVINSLQ